ncbi:MAG: UbiA family prenyltransferase, partial [Planctomycetia bacterium]
PSAGLSAAWLLLGGFAALWGVRWAAAVRRLDPPSVQAAVRTGVLGLILLDAAGVAAVAGPAAGLAVLLLFPLSTTIGRRLYTT